MKPTFMLGAMDLEQNMHDARKKFVNLLYKQWNENVTELSKNVSTG